MQLNKELEEQMVKLDRVEKQVSWLNSCLLSSK